MRKNSLIIICLMLCLSCFSQENTIRIKKKMTEEYSFLNSQKDTTFLIVYNDNFMDILNESEMKTFTISKTSIPAIANRGKQEIIYGSDVKMTLIYDKNDNFTKVVQISFYPFNQITTYLTE